MALIKDEKEGVTIIKIENDRLDSLITSDLKAELLLSVDSGSNKILMDVSQVVYADSSGLGALLFGVRQLQNVGGQMKLLGANRKVSNLIKIARLDDRLPNYEEMETALASFQDD
ncbi:STAS domain-containing protein [candidate division KSB1 bacterium]|nr:STAS domain-containing protein [candidate division KSB1 bacterium]